MKPIKVIGIGSPFGQDQLGWQVIEQLQQSLAASSRRQQLRLLCSDRPGLRLLELIKDTTAVILIDAIDNKACCGQILQLDRSQLLHTEHPLSSHAVCVSEVLSLGQALGELPEEIVLFGMCVDIADAQPIARQHIHQLCNHIQHYIDQSLMPH